MLADLLATHSPLPDYTSLLREPSGYPIQPPGPLPPSPARELHNLPRETPKLQIAPRPKVRSPLPGRSTPRRTMRLLPGSTPHAGSSRPDNFSRTPTSAASYHQRSASSLPRKHPPRSRTASRGECSRYYDFHPRRRKQAPQDPRAPRRDRHKPRVRHHSRPPSHHRRRARAQNLRSHTRTTPQTPTATSSCGQCPRRTSKGVTFAVLRPGGDAINLAGGTRPTFVPACAPSSHGATSKSTGASTSGTQRSSVEHAVTASR